MGDRLATIDMDRRKGGLLCPFVWGQLGLHLTQCCLGQGLPPYQVVYPDPFSRLATIDMGRKVEGCCAPFLAGELGPV